MPTFDTYDERDFADLCSHSEVFDALVASGETGMVCRAGDRPIFVNIAAHTMFNERDGITLNRQARLIVGDIVAAKRLKEAEVGVFAGRPGGIVRVQRPSGKRDYIIRVSGPSPTDNYNRSQRLLYLIHDPERIKKIVWTTVKEILGLPPGPSKVVAAILNGQTLQSYSYDARITVHTARNHLKIAFRITDCNSQAGLLRLAIIAVARLGL